MRTCVRTWCHANKKLSVLFAAQSWKPSPGQKLLSSKHDGEHGHSNDSISPLKNFVNRNPHNLERLCYAIKDRGWGMEWEGYAKSLSSNFPRRNFYHRLILRNSSWNTYAEVEHHTGRIVVTASTKEKCIRSRLYQSTDVSAAACLGRIIASRCLRVGISCVSFRFPEQYKDDSQKTNVFRQSAEEEGLCLEEPSHIRLEHVKPHEHPSGPLPPQF